MGKRTVKDSVSSQGWAWLRLLLLNRLQASGRPLWFAAIGIAVFLNVAWAAVSTHYIYDSNGRLVVATNEAGQSARYRYDKLGNLVEIERLQPESLAVLGFSPGRGATGVEVRISGRGFSETLALNEVRFNGAAAVVTAASATELTAIVPATATTGPIAVAAGGQTATSARSFIIDENARPPLIDSVSPLIAGLGTSISVNGQYLAPVPSQTTIRFNSRSVTPSALTNLQAVFSVSSGMGSGKVSVTTPYGRAFSTEDVLVLPAGVLAGQIAQVKRLALDAPAEALSVAATGQYAAVIFDGDAGEYLSAQFFSISAASVDYTLYGVNNAVLASGAISATSPTFHLPRLPSMGTYMLLMKPATGPATWSMTIERAMPLVLNGDARSIATTVAGQGKRLKFTASRGANLGLGLTDLVTPGTSRHVQVTVSNSEGRTQALEFCEAQRGGCDVNLPNLPAGTYSIEIYSPSDGQRTMSFNVMLSSDVIGTLQPDSVQTFEIKRRGQNGRLSFSAVAGESVAFQVMGVTLMPEQQYVYYTYSVYKPDGTYLISGSAGQGTSQTFYLANLPATGTYVVLLDPSYGAALSAQVLLLTARTSEMEIDGAIASHSTTVPGQDVLTAFTATTQGQNLGLGVGDLVAPGAVALDGYFVYGPGGNQIGSSDNCGGCDINLFNLTAGRHYVLFKAPANGERTASFKTTLSSEVTGTLPRGVAQDLILPRQGQNGRLTFTAVGGESIVLRVTGQATVPANGNVRYKVLGPDGAFVDSMDQSTPGTWGSWEALTIPKLPVTGEYTVLVDPFERTLSTRILIATGTGGEVTVDGDTQSFATTVPAEWVYLTFAAAQGQNMGLAISDLVTPGTSNPVRVVVEAPPDYWYSVASTDCFAQYGGCDLNLSNLMEGTYRVEIRAPSGGQKTMSFKATVSTDRAGSMTPDSPFALDLSRRGQNGRLTFSGTAGEAVALQVAGQTTTPAYSSVYYTMHKPDGSVLTSVATSSAMTQFLSLPATGTYSIFVDPYRGIAATTNVMLATGALGGMVMNGPSGSHATNIPGQEVYLDFTTTTTADITFRVSDLVVAGTYNWVTTTIYNPDGSVLVSANCATTAGGCTLTARRPPIGTYRVLVRPVDSSQTMSFKTTLTSKR